MSLKKYIAQVEAQQLNEFAPSAPSSTSTATAPAAGQKVLVKPGKPQQQQQQPQATITSQSGKVIAQADAANAKKLGDLVNTGGVIMMDPMTGKPLDEGTLEEVAPPGMEDTVLALKKKFPGQEGRAYAIAWSQYNKKHGKKSSVKETNEDIEGDSEIKRLREFLDVQATISPNMSGAKSQGGTTMGSTRGTTGVSGISSTGSGGSATGGSSGATGGTASNRNSAAATNSMEDASSASNNQSTSSANLSGISNTAAGGQSGASLSTSQGGNAVNTNRNTATSRSAATSGRGSPITMSEGLQKILNRYPHEHKMCQEGWGMHESLYEALRDHYFEEGRISNETMHGDREALRRHVEDCYVKDTMEEGNHDAINSGMLDEQGVEEGLRNKVAAAGIAGALALGGSQLLPDPSKDHPILTSIQQQMQVTKDPLILQQLKRDFKRAEDSIKLDRGVPSDISKKYGEMKTDESTYDAMDEADEGSKLERMLRQTTKEETMFESKGKTEKTEKGLKHTGTYGKEYDTDEEGNEKKIVKDEPKKGRGRPKKDGGETGKGFDFTALSKVSGSKKPKKEVGKVSVKHKLTDKSRDEKADAEFEKDEAKKSDKKKSKKVDETISKWDAQLRTLLEGKEVVKEGLSVSTSVGNENMPDSVSITANDEDAHELLRLINQAGLGIKKDAHEELLKAHGASQEGGHFSTAGTEEPGDIDVVDFDGAQDEISGDVDDGMSAMKQMLAAMGIGKDAAPEPKHPEGFDGEEEEEEEGESDSDDKKQVVDEEDVEEGNKFLGNLAKAREEGKTEADLDGDGDMEKVEPASDSDDSDSDEDKDKVEEGQQTCNECGAMYEGHSHTCSHEKMEEDQLNEWANSPQGQSEDEQFDADMDFMLKVLAGGINKPKADQTVMPQTRVKMTESIDVAAEMRKLAGIR